MQKTPGVVDNADPVRIPVRSDADIRPVIDHRILEGPERYRIGRGQFAAKKRVVPVMDDRQFTSGRMEDRRQ